MNIASALAESIAESNWTLTEVGYHAKASAQQARRWVAGEAVPSADKLLILMRFLPGLAGRLGFTISPSHADPHRDTTLTSRGGRRGVQQRAS